MLSCNMWTCIFIGLSFVTPPAVTRGIQNEVACSGMSNLNQFRCQNGTGCIGMEYTCDGIQDCPDASDEAYCNNRRIDFWTEEPRLRRIRRQSTCENDQWKCYDGNCISVDNICNGEDDCVDRSDETNPICRRLLSRTNLGDCVLPPYPTHGTYKVSKFPNARPGDKLSSFTLTVSCRQGFGVVDPNSGDGSSTQQFSCVNGEYQYTGIPKCVRFCKLDPDPSVRYMCHVPGVGFKNCKNYVASGASVKPFCNKPLYNSIETLRTMKCNSGFWDYVADCPADCGRVTPKGTVLVVDGKDVKRGELPWHAGIYWKNATSHTQICGGSLISTNVVLSAAHCFWNGWKKRVMSSVNYAVSIGKLHRDWDSEEDFGVQKSDVKEIKVPPLFKGSAANYQEDIAVLILTTPFIYMPYIRPVCLYYDVDFENDQLQRGKSGKVAGWGLTSANGPHSEILQAVDMPFIPEDNCAETLPESFIEHITGDKFCAGHTTGKALCHGDSGGGLAFPDKGLGVTRYYLRGIVSVAPTDDDKMCNDKVYTAFTKVSKHQEFINKALAASVKAKCPPYAFQCDDGSCEDLGVDCNGVQDCADGSDETKELCDPGAKPELEPSTTNKPTPPTTPEPIPLPIRPIEPVSTGCVLPTFPEYVTYETNIPNIRPGQSYDTIAVTVTCREGYRIVNSDNGLSKNSTLAMCINGAWSEEIPKCVQFCRLQPDPSVEYRCRSPNATSLTECEEYVSVETIVSVSCNTRYYYYSDEELPDMNCISGSWDYAPRCKIECGRVTQEKMQLEIGWTFAKRGELPWHAGIYHKTTRPFMQVCGGSLISNNVVLSAAHCFWAGRHQLPSSNYAVAVGKLYRPWDDPMDVDAQKSDVKEVKIPSRFIGKDTDFEQDLAIVVVVTPFVYQPYVRPVCLNFDSDFEERQLVPGNLGKMAGWGLTKANSEASKSLKVTKMPFIETKPCKRTFPPYYGYFVSADKFCAGYINGTSAVCRGDGGGGLAFPNEEFGIDRYYLRGIASPAPIYVDSCNIHTYTLFSQVKKHEAFIKEYL